MKHFVLFLILIFSGLFAALVFRKNQDEVSSQYRTLRIFASQSFVQQWGPGPWLKEKFESTCDCRVEYHEAADTMSLIQRVKSEPQSKSVDLVFGLDQYDLELALQGIDWKNIKIDKAQFVEEVQSVLDRGSFIPYNWGVLGFIGRKNQIINPPLEISDLLKTDLKGQISIQDPRTSSLGLQFLIWLVQAMGEEKAFQFLHKFNSQVKTWGASWSLTYGLFEKEQVKVTFSYSTSPIAKLKQDPNSDYVVYPFKEGHPIQYEFMGIPATCLNCDLAEKFIELVLSKEGQKIIMDKNYMFPVINGVKSGTLFDSVAAVKIIEMNSIPNISERERLLKKWSIIRRSE